MTTPKAPSDWIERFIRNKIPCSLVIRFSEAARCHGSSALVFVGCFAAPCSALNKNSVIGKIYQHTTFKSKPAPQTLLDILKEEKRGQVHGGIYHKIQIELTYNSSHIEGSRLTHDQTRYIFETNTIGITAEGVRVDDIIETSAHFRCIDEIIENAKSQLSEKLIKHLHFILKIGTSDSKKDWFAVGDYKKLPNEVGGRETTLPEEVSAEMKKLLADYNGKENVALEDTDTCLSVQDTFKKYLDDFRISY